MKISVFTVCTPECDPAQTVALLARYGFDGVEWRVQRIDPALAGEPPSYWRHNLSTVDLDRILTEGPAVRDLTRSAGLAMPALATYVPCSDYENAERVMQAAQAMGVPMLRLAIPRYDRLRPYGQLFAETRTHLQHLTRVANRYGVRLLVEIHLGTIAPSAGLTYRLLEGLPPDRAGAIFDPGNMVCEGYEAWRLGMELLGPYLAHVHVKNYAWQPAGENAHGTLHWAPQPAALSRGMVDWGQVLDDLKAVGYDGYLSLEDFFPGACTEDKLRDDIAYLKSLGA